MILVTIIGYPNSTNQHPNPFLRPIRWYHVFVLILIAYITSRRRNHRWSLIFYVQVYRLSVELYWDPWFDLMGYKNVYNIPWLHLVHKFHSTTWRTKPNGISGTIVVTSDYHYTEKSLYRYQQSNNVEWNTKNIVRTINYNIDDE